ncbi:MAG: hypothetical protein JSS34_08860, partial [Proteobacteria bacterium]|nr:hypothetical protein [Pseudomonadota bacterium]
MTSAVEQAARKHFGVPENEYTDASSARGFFADEEQEEGAPQDPYVLRGKAKVKALSRNTASRSYAHSQTARALDPRGAVAHDLGLRAPTKMLHLAEVFSSKWHSELSVSNQRFESFITERESLQYAQHLWNPSSDSQKRAPLSKDFLKHRPRSNSLSAQEVEDYFWSLTGDHL